MDLINETRFSAGYAPGRFKSGRDCLVLVAKATYTMPSPGGEETPRLLAKQPAPLLADEALGDPANTPILYENDYAPGKVRCDVTLVGSACSQTGQPVTEIPVQMQVGTMRKGFNVVGNRYWRSDFDRVVATQPEPFIKMPIHYGNAYGGMGNFEEAREEAYMYPGNMLGKGYYGKKVSQDWVGQALPNTEEHAVPIARPIGDYVPMSFGPIARNTPARLQYAGTYDEQWERDKAPFLPDDFDEQFYQAAPADQQIPFIEGGEQVVLHNLSDDGVVRFTLPKERLNMHVVYRNGERKDLLPVVDTLVLETEKKQFSMTWRTVIDLRRNMKEVETMIVGHPSRAWEIARLRGKTYVPLSRLKDYRHILRR